MEAQPGTGCWAKERDRVTKPTEEILDQSKNKYKEEDKNRNGERRVLALSWRSERESLRSSALGFRSRDRGKSA